MNDCCASENELNVLSVFHQQKKGCQNNLTTFQTHRSISIIQKKAFPTSEKTFFQTHGWLVVILKMLSNSRNRFCWSRRILRW